MAIVIKDNVSNTSSITHNFTVLDNDFLKILFSGSSVVNHHVSIKYTDASLTAGRYIISEKSVFGKLPLRRLLEGRYLPVTVSVNAYNITLRQSSAASALYYLSWKSTLPSDLTA